MDIRISKCAQRCRVCDDLFFHEQCVHSVAQKLEEGWDRLDFCAACFAEQPLGGAFSAWETRYLDARVLEAERQEELTPMRRVFYELASGSDRIHQAQAYLAAQLLKRQKAFRQIKEAEDDIAGRRVSLFLDRSGNRMIEVCDLNFTYDELNEARRLLMERLQSLENPDTNPSSENEPPEQVNDHVQIPAHGE